MTEDKEKKAFEPDPDKRDWEYDGEGHKRYKDTFEPVKEQKEED